MIVIGWALLVMVALGLLLGTLMAYDLFRASYGLAQYVSAISAALALWVFLPLTGFFIVSGMRRHDITPPSHPAITRTLSPWGADEESVGRMAWICGEAHMADKKGIFYDGLKCEALRDAIGLGEPVVTTGDIR